LLRFCIRVQSEYLICRGRISVFERGRGTDFRERIGLAEACGFGNPRYSRLGNLPSGARRKSMSRTAGCQTCCIADFQIGWA
jgi:hypothetical protein